MIPLCRWSLPRLCGFPSADRTGYCLRRPITSSRRASPSFRVFPSNTYPTAATVESSHGLSLPAALQASEVHFSQASPTRYVPSSGFGYPLDGLLPRKPCRFCFAPAALLGFALRRFPLPKGLHGVSAGKNPPAVSLPVNFRHECRTGRTSLDFWVHTFRKCLAVVRAFRPTPAGASLELCPFRASPRRP